MNLTLRLSQMYLEEGFSSGKVLDLRRVEQTHCYCSSEASTALREALAGFGPCGVHHIDSGDYHYVTLFFLEQIKEDFCLVLIDNHPDDQGCAFDGDLLSCGSWVAKARESVANMKSDVRVFGAEDVFTKVPEGLPVYLSIDLDALRAEDFRTDWDQGGMSVSILMEILNTLHGHRIIGVDICGGITLEKGGTSAELERNKRVREMVSELKFLTK